jgi:hypothetical protein
LEWVNLYARRASPGTPLPIFFTLIKINDAALLEKEIQAKASELFNGHAGGASGMHAKHVKNLLWGALAEEVLRTGACLAMGIIGACFSNWSRQPRHTETSLISFSG